MRCADKDSRIDCTRECMDEVDVGTKKSRHEVQRILLVPTVGRQSYNDAASFLEAFPGFLDAAASLAAACRLMPALP